MLAVVKTMANNIESSIRLDRRSPLHLTRLQKSQNFVQIRRMILFRAWTISLEDCSLRKIAAVLLRWRAYEVPSLLNPANETS